MDKISLSEFWVSLFFSFDLASSGVDECWIGMLTDVWDVSWLSLISSRLVNCLMLLISKSARQLLVSGSATID